MGVLCYCLVTIKKLAVFRCKYNSRNATICYVLFFKSKFYSSLFLIKDDIAKLKIFLRKLRSPNRFTSVWGFFYTSTDVVGVECVAVGEVWRIMAEKWRDILGV